MSQGQDNHDLSDVLRKMAAGENSSAAVVDENGVMKEVPEAEEEAGAAPAPSADGAPGEAEAPAADSDESVHGIIHVEGEEEGESAAPSGEVDDESGEVIARATPAAAPTRSTYQPAAAPRRKVAKADTGLRLVTMPIFLTVGVLLVGFAIYGLTLLGDDSAQGKSARTMGLTFAIVGGGFGLVLLAIGGFQFKLYQREKSQQSRRP